jgi:hypothetical protein
MRKLETGDRAKVLTDEGVAVECRVLGDERGMLILCRKSTLFAHATAVEHNEEKAMPRCGDNVHIPLDEKEALRLMLKVKRTAEMPRLGASQTKAKRKRATEAASGTQASRKAAHLKREA